MDKRKLVSSAIVVMALMASFGMALWSFTWTGMSIVTVTSENPNESILVTSNLDTNLIDVTNSSQTVIDSVTIRNINEPVNVSVIYNASINYVTGVNCVPNSDITIIPGQENFTLAKNETKILNVTYNVKKWSCPGNASVQLNLTASPV